MGVKVSFQSSKPLCIHIMSYWAHGSNSLSGLAKKFLGISWQKRGHCDTSYSCGVLRHWLFTRTFQLFIIPMRNLFLFLLYSDSSLPRYLGFLKVLLPPDVCPTQVTQQGVSPGGRQERRSPGSLTHRTMSARVWDGEDSSFVCCFL